MTKNWTVNKLAIDSNNQEFENLVHYVEFNFEYSDEDLSDNFTLLFKFDPPTENFVDYENLTEEIVLGWLFAKEDFEKIENNFIDAVKNPINDVTFEETLPFNN